LLGLESGIGVSISGVTDTVLADPSFLLAI
jgi:hypothetical protein